jgi:hypothetical protein
MRYEEFRDQLQIALQNVGLLGQRIGNPIETVELDSMGRRWKVYIVGNAATSTEPFHVTAKIAFNWNPFDSARSYTCEEDLLTDLLGRSKSSSKTEPRFILADLELYARLPHGSTTAIPAAKAFGPWADSIKQKLDKVFNESKWRQGRLIAVLGSLEEIHIESKCDSSGHLSIQGISVAGFRMVRVPRIWDTPDRRAAEKGPAAELSRFAQMLRYSLDEWMTSVAELARWIRYTPPPDGAKQISASFEEHEDEEKKGGSETIH